MFVERFLASPLYEQALESLRENLQLTVETSMGLKHVISEISTVIQITVETSMGFKHVISETLPNHR